MSWFDRSLWMLVAIVVLTQAFIELQMVYGRINVPIADLAAVLLSALFGLEMRRRARLPSLFSVARFVPAGAQSTAPSRLPLVAPWAFAAFLLTGVVSLVNSPRLFESAYFLLRKPIFSYVVYGMGLTGALLYLRNTRAVYGLSLLFVAVASTVCIAATIPLWQQGYYAAFMPVPHLTANQKALAVAVAPYVPFIFMGRDQYSPRLRYAADLALVLALIAILMTVTKTAWITLAFGAVGLLRWPLRWGKRLLERPGLMVPALAGVGAAMVALPFVLQSRLMADSFSSRMSLNLRAWEMFRQHPLLGYGAGTSTLFELGIPPHYRINGVDAHGVVQKVGAELGILGLAAYLAFSAVVLRGLWRTAFAPEARPDPLTIGAVCMGLGLHVNLLLSTEYFTSSHWTPLAVALAIALAQRQHNAVLPASSGPEPALERG